MGLYLGYLPYFPLWVGPPPAAAVCPGRVIPALGATGLVPYTPLSLNFSLHIRGLGHATLEPPDLHAYLALQSHPRTLTFVVTELFAQAAARTSSIGILWHQLSRRLRYRHFLAHL